MNGKELMESYPTAIKIIRSWFMDKLIESVRKNWEVSEKFKNEMLAKGVSDDTLILMLEESPRACFDVMDDNGIFVIIQLTGENKFSWFILPERSSEDELYENTSDFINYPTRKEAEHAAIANAFKILDYSKS